MQVHVNETIRNLPDNLTITGLLEELGYDEARVSVKRNGEAVAKSLFAEITVNDGDRVELLESGSSS